MKKAITCRIKRLLNCAYSKVLPYEIKNQLTVIGKGFQSQNKWNFPFRNIFFVLIKIFMFLYYTKEDSDNVINSSIEFPLNILNSSTEFQCAHPLNRNSIYNN